MLSETHVVPPPVTKSKSSPPEHSWQLPHGPIVTPLQPRRKEEQKRTEYRKKSRSPHVAPGPPDCDESFSVNSSPIVVVKYPLESPESPLSSKPSCVSCSAMDPELRRNSELPYIEVKTTSNSSRNPPILHRFLRLNNQ